MKWRHTTTTIGDCDVTWPVFGDVTSMTGRDVTMAIFRSCCMCCTLRTGAFVSGIYTLVSVSMFFCSVPAYIIPIPPTKFAQISFFFYKTSLNSSGNCTIWRNQLEKQTIGLQWGLRIVPVPTRIFERTKYFEDLTVQTQVPFRDHAERETVPVVFFVPRGNTEQ